jgi:hypothetical protein
VASRAPSRVVHGRSGREREGGSHSSLLRETEEGERRGLETGGRGERVSPK